MRKEFPRLVCFLCIFFAVNVCLAVPVQSTIPATNEDTLYIGGGNGDDTGVRILNGSANPTTATIDILTGQLPRSEESISDGFLLLDNSLTVNTSPNIDGQMRSRVRIAYSDSRLRAKGLVRSRLRLFRLDGIRKRWIPAVNLIRDKRVEIRRLPRIAKDFVLGHHGYYDNGAGGGYVWAVLDVGGEYAIGNVPEPTTLMILGTGVSLLLAKRRRRNVS
jgi:hypothetical protein